MIFFCDLEFLEELLAGPHPGKRDVYLLIRLEPGKRYDVDGQVKIFTGSPISRINISPPSPIAPACSTS